jgi:organic radical activating enzyme
MAEVNEPKETQKSGSKKGLIIAFIIILLAINAVQLFLNINKSNDIAAKDKTIVEAKAKIDSTTLELNNAIDELKLKQQEIARLGGDTAALGEQIRNLQLESEKLRNESATNYSLYIRIKKEIDRANQIARDASAEVERLKAQLAAADSSIKEYQSQVVASLDTINQLKVTQNELAEKVAIASVLKAESFRIDAITAKGKVKDGGEFKAKNIDKLKISFYLADNKVAKQEGKEIILRVVEPDGGALFDVGTGGGTFQYEGKEIFYTLKQEILFDNRKPQVVFTYVKGSAYKPGKHNVEVYAEGYKIGEGSFIVK